MAQVTWAPSALDDIDAIAEYIARDSPELASLFVTRLVEAVRRLEQFPLSGRPIPEFNHPDYREIVYNAYRVMYRVEGSDIWITGVVHGARDWKLE